MQNRSVSSVRETRRGVADHRERQPGDRISPISRRPAATALLRKRAQIRRRPTPANVRDGHQQSVRTRRSRWLRRCRSCAQRQEGICHPGHGQAAIVGEIEKAFATPKRALILDELAEQNGTPPTPPTPTINQQLERRACRRASWKCCRRSPKQLEYDFVGRTLMVRDVDADVVIDFGANALPEIAPAAIPAASAKPQPPGATSPLPMPSIRGGTVFAVMGDSGSGDQAQQAVAQAMLTYFNTARRFPFVLMLGDNLYDDDYTNEFSIPYKPLLDRGVKFYAALGNHDRDLEIHFKPFNMNDVDRYKFDQGNARFVVLNSNHPTDPQQIKWLDQAYADAGTKWRIAFFHHPLYSSGQHAAESRDVIRPALEPALVRNHVNVVFSGHEHLYERIKPQQEITYFVSGGGGRYLYDYKPSAFDEIGLSEHHFMVVQIAGDRMFFEAITHAQRLIDCGVSTAPTTPRRRSRTTRPPSGWPTASRPRQAAHHALTVSLVCGL